jgi:putative hydrolase of the HAD superfamily
MQNTKITTLFLDIGGVLLTDGWGREQRHNAIEKFSLDKEQFEDRNALVWATYESDIFTLDQYLDYVVFYEKRDFTKQDFKECMMAQSQPIDGALDYFKLLKKERSYKVVALSNEARELNAYRIETYKLNELFDYYVSSCYVGLRKPDPAMYKLAFDTAQVSAEQAVYIDDRLPYIEIARSCGIESLHYTGIDSAKNYFKNSLV